MVRATCVSLLGIVCAACVQDPHDEMVRRLATPVIYGVDDRSELLEAPEGAQALFRAALVALVPASRIQILDSGQAVIKADLLGATQGLCPNVKFSNEPSAATCTGTLVKENLVLTARHCVTSLEQCRLLRWVFGYAYAANGELAALGPDDVYGCQRIVAAAFDPARDLDFAWVELDRPVVGRPPMLVSTRSTPLAPGTRLWAAGFGQGLPAKFDPNVEVLASFENYFTATLDAFTGSSGMPVVTPNGILVGFSLRGENDYVTAGSCKVPQILGPKCEGCAFGGERVAYLTAAVGALEAERIGESRDGGFDAATNAMDASTLADALGSTVVTDAAFVTDAAVAVGSTVVADAEPFENAGPAIHPNAGASSDDCTSRDAQFVSDPNQGNDVAGEPSSAGSRKAVGPACSIARSPGKCCDDGGCRRWFWVLLAWAARRRRVTRSSYGNWSNAAGRERSG